MLLVRVGVGYALNADQRCRHLLRAAGEGPPVVMAHGAGFDHRWWEPQVEALVENYEVVTYDLRGHGHEPVAGRTGTSTRCRCTRRTCTGS